MTQTMARGTALDAALDGAPDGLLDDPIAITAAADALAGGAAVAHGFGNLYAITARGDGDAVRAVNRLTGRPLDQVASVTLPPSSLADVFDWQRLPVGVSRARMCAVFDAFFALGPFGFRGPAVDGLDPVVTRPVNGRPTVQLIAPGYGCTSNAFLASALRATSGQPLSITSANRSRHLDGVDDAPAHWRADELRAEFDPGSLVLLRHRDEVYARRRFPYHLPMSTTILGFDRTPWIGGRPHLFLERRGSLPDDIVRAVLARLGFGMLVGPQAHNRARPRVYADD